MHKRSSLWSTRIRGSTSVDLSKGIVVLPLSLFLFLFLFFLFFCIFLWPQWLFLFNSHLFSSGSFILSTLGSFPNLGQTLYLQEGKGNLSHFTRYSKS